MKITSATVIGFSTALCALSVVQIGQPEPASAQGSDGMAKMCMERAASGEGMQATQIVVPAAAKATMEAKGFEQFQCGKGGFGVAEQAAFRDKVCGMAANAPTPVQDQLEIAMGERPAVLCGMAELVLGASVNGGGQEQ